jgi:hypothetical protein
MPEADPHHLQSLIHLQRLNKYLLEGDNLYRYVMDGVGTARENDCIVGSQLSNSWDVLLEDSVGFPTVSPVEEDTGEQSLEMNLGLEFVGIERGGAEIDDRYLLGGRDGGGGVADGEERGEVVLVEFLLNCQRGGLYIKVR